MICPMVVSAALVFIVIGSGVALAATQDGALREAARLDAEQKCGEAERYYQDLLAKSPASLALLNNVGNHYLVCRQPEKARLYFERVIKLNPMQTNANLQLARIATDQKQGTKALAYLARLKDSDPAVLLLRAEAAHYAGKDAVAQSILADMQRATDDPQVLFAIGTTSARIQQYAGAEAAFNRVLAADPENFDVLFSLGRAAARSGHYERARSALEVAVKLKPEDADALFELGLAATGAGDHRRAVYVLAQARQRMPGRPDIVLALARAAESAGFYGDAAVTFDEYLRLRPDDDTARRDLALAHGNMDDVHARHGLEELTSYLLKHPNDPVAHFDLAQLIWKQDSNRSLEELSVALRIDTGFAAAYYARAWLLHRFGRIEESLSDLQACVKLDPRSVEALTQLGATYVELDLSADAEKVLRQALVLSPQHPQALMNLARALTTLDRSEEAQQYFEAFRRALPPTSRNPLREPGMIELATLPQPERVRLQIERLQEQASTHPGDPELQLSLAGLLLSDGQIDGAKTAFRALLDRNAGARIYHRAGRILLEASQYELAREFLERTAASVPDARVDLALAVFAAGDLEKALQYFDGVPVPEQTAEFCVAKARILAAAGRQREAEEVLQKGVQRADLQPDAAEHAAALLIQYGRAAQARMVLQHVRGRENQANMLLAEAIATALGGDPAGAAAILTKVESRWPEWDRAYLAHGLVLEQQQQVALARQKIQIAIALKDSDRVAQCAWSRLSGKGAKIAECVCGAGLREMLVPDCQ